MGSKITPRDLSWDCSSWPIGLRVAERTVWKPSLPNRFTIAGYSRMPYCVSIVRDGCRAPGVVHITNLVPL
jgi:hypothetical protein